PIVPGLASDAIPRSDDEPEPSIDKRPVTLTVTLPPFPVFAGKPLKAANSLLEIKPLTIASVPALTVTPPALPLLPCAVSDEISPPFRTDKAPALTATLPAFPFPNVSLAIIDPAPSIDDAPLTLTETLPPAPVPNVSLTIAPLLAIDKLPAVTVTCPA